MLLFFFLLLFLSFYSSLLLFSWDDTVWRQRPFLFPVSLCLQNLQGSGVERSATCLCQGPDGNCFKLCRPCGLCRQLSLPVGHEGRFRPYMNVWAWPCANKTLSMDMDIWVSIFIRHKILFFLFSFQPFSNAKTILSLPAITKHGSRQDLALGP